MSDKFKIGGAVARQAMRELVSKELIVWIGDHSSSVPLFRGSQWSLKKEQEEALKKVAPKAKKDKEAKNAAKEEAEDNE